MQVTELLSRVVKIVDLGEGLQPGLPALLLRNAIRPPAGQIVIESFVGCSYHLLLGKRHARLVEICEIADAVIAGGGHHPGITAVAKRVSETVAVLKKKNGMCAQRSIRGVPVDGIVLIDSKVGHNRMPLSRHVRGRREICVLHVLKFSL